MSRDFVTVASFASTVDVMLARAQLEAAGIETFVPAEHTLTTLPYLVDAQGGVALQVHEADAERALELLSAPAPPSAPDEDDADEIHCAACGSSYVVFGQTGFGRILSALGLGALAPARHRCRACGHAFDEPRGPPASHPYR